MKTRNWFLLSVGSFLILLVLSVLENAALTAPSGQLSAEQIMERNFSSTRLERSYVTATMELISSKGEKRVRQQRGVSKLKGNGLDNRGITIFDLPNDIKNAAVYIDKDRSSGDKVWVYGPIK